MSVGLFNLVQVNNTGAVIASYGNSPDFPTFSGFWAVGSTPRTFANAAVLAGGADGHTTTISAVQSVSQAGFVRITFNGANGNTAFLAEMETGGTVKIGFFDANTLAARQAITGALSTVTDAAAKAVLTSIITALVNYNLATNGTT